MLKSRTSLASSFAALPKSYNARSANHASRLDFLNKQSGLHFQTESGTRFPHVSRHSVLMAHGIQDAGITGNKSCAALHGSLDGFNVLHLTFDEAFGPEQIKGDLYGAEVALTPSPTANAASCAAAADTLVSPRCPRAATPFRQSLFGRKPVVVGA